MRRAALLVGVDRTGELPALEDAAAGARRMARWARAQGMDPVQLITDERRKAVTVEQVKRTVRKIIELGTIEQLLVYFAGHGMNKGYSEYWLLSDAPGDTGAAVNVDGSAELARRGGINHVVFISDACRTAADGTRMLRVTGNEIFLNNDFTGGTDKYVDRFFPCALGDSAFEIRDFDTARQYRAIYTASLLAALKGTRPTPVEWTETGSGRTGYIRPHPLKVHLEADVTRRLAALDLQQKILQQPDARISSDEHAWISRITSRARPRRSLRAAPRDSPVPGAGEGEIPPLFKAEAETRLPSSESAPLQSLLTPAVAGDVIGLTATIGASAIRARSIATSVVSVSRPFDQPQFETNCGILVRGGTIAEAFSPRATLKPLANGAALLVTHAEAPSTSVLLAFEDGRGAVVPAIPGFIAGLTLEDGELTDIAYEPSWFSRRHGDFQRHAVEVRALRAIASSYTKHGIFQLEGDDTLTLARRMQHTKSVDPTLAVYAAYAYQDLGRRDLVRNMCEIMRADLGGAAFDIALLAGELEGRRSGGDLELLSFVPMLAQGWALLSAHRVNLPPSLTDIDKTLASSAWTMFDSRGVEQIRYALSRGEIR